MARTLERPPAAPSRPPRVPARAPAPVRNGRRAPAHRASTTPTTTAPPASASGHIGGLDGLRAIAVVAVLLYHLSGPLLPGGYLGVDIFFVVSGFLITTLLIRELAANNRLNLGRFWLRRARRLLPALVLVVVVSVAAGLLIGQDLLVGIGRQTLGALTFSNNWVEIAAGSSYFTHTSPQLFVNFWSLAVEEQFYLLWPFVFLALMVFARSNRVRMGICAGGALVSAILMAVLYTPGTDPTRVYFGTDTHAFGLLIGATLAFLWAGERSLNLSRPLWQQRRVAIGCGVLALLVVALIFMSADGWFAYRGGILLVSILTAVLILTLLEGTSPLQRALDWGPVAWIGQRSYGIYLWHWPALVIAGALIPAPINSALWWFTRIGALVMTVVLSALSFTYVERPIRRYGFRACGAAAIDAVRAGGRAITGPRVIAGTAALVTVLALIGIATAPEKSQVQQSIERNQELVSGATSVPESVDAQGAPSSNEGTNDDGDARPALNYPAGTEITAIGDSMIVTSADGLKDRFPGIAFDAESNRQWPAGLAAIDSDLNNGTVRRAVVIHFGTNAGLNDPDAVSAMVDKLGPERMVVLVNLYGASGFVDESNKALADIAKDRHNVIVADWNGAISKRPDLLQPDQIHPGLLGAHLYADTVKQALHDLAKRTGGTVPADWAISADY